MQMYVKLSAFFRISAEPYPFLDARLLMSDLVAAFGADRLMWGTDFPWVDQEYGFSLAMFFPPCRVTQRSGHALSSRCVLEWVKIWITIYSWVSRVDLSTCTSDAMWVGISGQWTKWREC